MNIDEMKDRIARAEEIQRYTENRCEALEKENAELKAQLESERDLPAIAYMKKKNEEQITIAKELLKQWLQTSNASGCDNINIVTDTEQFLSEMEKCGQ